MAPEADDSQFASSLIAWQRSHGRHGLPWQNTRDPYQVWLSEVMLQQTQVRTVMVYYARFLERFPTVQALAAAEQDEVLSLWTGLGYYTRARNMHACARQVVRDFGGYFPQTSALLVGLPGIGPSTAAAIAAFCFCEHISIMDGNVKRVLGRWLAFDGDLAQASAVAQLWRLANNLTPNPDRQEGGAMATYTQALMDLGSLVCTTRKPNCAVCPVVGSCRAVAKGDPVDFPRKTKKLKRTSERWWLLLFVQTGTPSCSKRVWLQARPQTGVWAGLYTPLILESERVCDALAAGISGAKVEHAAPVKHVLTHKDIYLHWVRLEVAGATPAGDGRWFEASELCRVGLPAPVTQWIAAEFSRVA